MVESDERGSNIESNDLPSLPLPRYFAASENLIQSAMKIMKIWKISRLFHTQSLVIRAKNSAQNLRWCLNEGSLLFKIVFEVFNET